MKIVEMYGESRVGTIDVPEPEPRDNWVVVKVIASTICGTEARTYQIDGTSSSHAYNSGHEAAGVVWKAGPQAKIAEGTRVAVIAHLGEQCNQCFFCYQGLWLLCTNLTEGGEDYLGTHAQYISRPDTHCIPMPDDVPFEIGSILVDAVGHALPRDSAAGRQRIRHRADHGARAARMRRRRSSARSSAPG